MLFYDLRHKNITPQFRGDGLRPPALFRDPCGTSQLKADPPARRAEAIFHCRGNRLKAPTKEKRLFVDMLFIISDALPFRRDQSRIAGDQLL